MHQGASSGDWTTTVETIPPTFGGNVAAFLHRHARLITASLGPLTVFLQFVLAIAVIYRADLLTPGFRRVLMLAAGGFIVHHLLPMRFRMRAFAVLCMASVLLVMGWSSADVWSGALAIKRALPALAVGGTLAGICVLPIGFWSRVALLLAGGSVAAVLRAGYAGGGGPSLVVIWPIIASLFMFRVISYFYTVSTSKARPGLAASSAYFTLFPNICIGLFPVVDFKTFLRSHYDSDALAIYQRGVKWIIRGIVQLMVYRVIKQSWAIAPEGVTDGATLVQFIATNVFLYLNVSGQFHLFVGLLLLFGFNLPETNRRYFLASSFTEYWRRVNIYWKDFILAIVYYPTYFRLKRRGDTFALVVATLVSFFVTWILHLYQTWWLKGSATMSWSDALFWFALGLLVLGNALWETKHGRTRRSLTNSHTVRSAFGLCLRTAATFATLAVLWSLWSTPGLRQWLNLWRFADLSTVFWAAVVLLVVMVATVVFEVRLSSFGAAAPPAKSQASIWAIARPFLQGTATLIITYALCTATLQARFDSPRLQWWHDAINTGDSMRDVYAARNGGYYEKLTKPDAGGAQLWEAIMGRPMPYAYGGADPIRTVQDVRFFELLPNVDTYAYNTHFKTNRWGMRDQDYEQQKPANTFRIALVGPSQSMGWAVEQDEVFESLLERRLNAAQLAGPDVRFEVLNFSTYGRNEMGQAHALEHWVRPFQPDLVLFVAHSIDGDWLARDLPRSLRNRIVMPYKLPYRILDEARVTARTHEVIAAERMKKYQPALAEWGYGLVADGIRSLGARPVAMYLPVPIELPITGEKLEWAGKQTGMLRGAGFDVIDLTHLYRDETRQSLAASEGWEHSNARAHWLIADALFKALATDRSIDLIGQAKAVAVEEDVAIGSTHTSWGTHAEFKQR